MLIPEFVPVGQDQRRRRPSFSLDVVQQMVPGRDHQGEQRLEPVEQLPVGGELESFVQGSSKSNFRPLVRSFPVPIGDVPGGDRQLSHGNHMASGHQRHRALRSGVEFANRFDLVSEKFDADGAEPEGEKTSMMPPRTEYSPTELTGSSRM